MPNPLLIEVWSDVVCPWCAIGKAHLDDALARFEHRGETRVVWRSYELDPGAPAVREGAYAAHLARRYSATEAGGRSMAARLSHAGELAGLMFRLDLVRPANSFDAHRLLHLARTADLEGPVLARLQRGYLQEGALISDHPTLVRLGAEAGLDPARSAAALADGSYADDVRAEEEDGLRRGVTAVPTLLLDSTASVPGAQSADSLLSTLRRVWARSGR